MSETYKNGVLIDRKEVVFDGVNDYEIFSLINDYTDEYIWFGDQLSVEKKLIALMKVDPKSWKKKKYSVFVSTVLLE